MSVGLTKGTLVYAARDLCSFPGTMVYPFGIHILLCQVLGWTLVFLLSSCVTR